MNPFSTRFWQAGVLPFQFESGITAESLLDRMKSRRVWQIVGPHGSGKSTLVNELIRTLHSEKVHFVEDYESLPFYRRWYYRFSRKPCVLIVHRKLWSVPVLYEAKPRFDVFEKITQQLSECCLPRSVLEKVLHRAGGNFRTAFFTLYDLIENE